MRNLINRALLLAVVGCVLIGSLEATLTTSHNNTNDATLTVSILATYQFQNANDTFNFGDESRQTTLKIKYRNRECLKCQLLDLVNITTSIDSNVTVDIKTAYPYYKFYVFDDRTNERVCAENLTDEFRMGENAAYLLEITPVNETSGAYVCEFKTVNKGDWVYFPLIVSGVALVVLAIVYAILKILICRVLFKNYFANRMMATEFGAREVASMSANSMGSGASTYTQLLEEDTSINQIRSMKKKLNRVQAIDVLRGVSLAIMIFVNYGAGGYASLDHAVWNGLHLADLVFPCFIFTMGASIPLSFKSISSSSIDRLTGQRVLNVTNVLWKIARRTLLLFFFGLIISNSSDQYLTQLRIMGVLQRFAVSYFVCAMLEFIYFKWNNYVYVGVNMNTEPLESPSWSLFFRSKFKEIFLYPIQWLVVLALIAAWTSITLLLPVKGCPTGYLGPGGLDQNGSFVNCTGGAAGYLDRLILGERHVYSDPTCKKIYQTKKPHDPEGLLGCLTSCVLAYLGLMTGHVIVHYQEPIKRMARFLFYALVFGAIGLTLCNFSWNNGWIPINKNLWSLSYILVMACISLVALIVLYIVVDVYDLVSGAPFLYLGRNSITVYMGHEILGDFFPLFKVDNKHSYQMAINIYWVALWCIVAALMNHKKVYINL